MAETEGYESMITHMMNSNRRELLCVITALGALALFAFFFRHCIEGEEDPSLVANGGIDPGGHVKGNVRRRPASDSGQGPRAPEDRELSVDPTEDKGARKNGVTYEILKKQEPDRPEIAYVGGDGRARATVSYATDTPHFRVRYSHFRLKEAAHEDLMSIVPNLRITRADGSPSTFAARESSRKIQENREILTDSGDVVLDLWLDIYIDLVGLKNEQGDQKCQLIVETVGMDDASFKFSVAGIRDPKLHILVEGSAVRVHLLSEIGDSREFAMPAGVFSVDSEDGTAIQFFPDQNDRRVGSVKSDADGSWSVRASYVADLPDHGDGKTFGTLLVSWLDDLGRKYEFDCKVLY